MSWPLAILLAAALAYVVLATRVLVEISGVRWVVGAYLLTAAVVPVVLYVGWFGWRR